MIIVNSKQFNSHQNAHLFQTSRNSISPQKQFASIPQLLAEEQQSVLEWIKQNFADQYSHCGTVNKIEDLFDGVSVAEIVSHFLPNQHEKQQFLNQIQLVSHLSNKKTAVKNLNFVIQQIKLIFQNILSIPQNGKSNKNLSEIKQILNITNQSLQRLKGQHLINDKTKMKNFIMQVIMLLPEIQCLNLLETKTKLNKESQYLSKSQQKYALKEKRIPNEVNQFNTNNGIEELSSIMMNFGSENQNKYNSRNALHNNLSNLNQQQEYFQMMEQSQSQNPKLQDKMKIKSEEQYLFQEKVESLLDWIQNTFNLSISQLQEPHLLLGQLVNAILSPHGRLKSNQKLIKPSHYQLGSYAVYKKAINILIDVQRLNKTNLIKLMKEVEIGKVKQDTFWPLIEDIRLMSRNKALTGAASALSSRNIQPKQILQKSNQKKTRKNTLKTQKQQTEYDQNINVDNIKNQSVTQLLRQNQNRKQSKIKTYPLYDQNIIKQTQLWLQQQMGMGHGLQKSKPSSGVCLFQNPLLNGCLLAKLVQRLKIGCAKGITTPSQKKQLKNNIQIIKCQLIKRGYQCGRKLCIYKGTYNFYIGLISQIKQTFINKQFQSRQLLMLDKNKKMRQQQTDTITQQQKQILSQWIQNEYKQKTIKTNGIKCISLKQLNIIVISIINVNFLKETTQKIRFNNYVKLLEFFRSIGFIHYSEVNVEDFICQFSSNEKKTQNIRWMIVRDLKIIKGDKIVVNTTRTFTNRQ